MFRFIHLFNIYLVPSTYQVLCYLGEYKDELNSPFPQRIYDI